MVGRQKQKRSRVKKRFASAEPNGSVASIRSYGFAHVQCRVMCEASQNLSSFTLRLNRAPDGSCMLPCTFGKFVKRLVAATSQRGERECCSDQAIE